MGKCIECLKEIDSAAELCGDCEGQKLRVINRGGDEIDDLYMGVYMVRDDGDLELAATFFPTGGFTREEQLEHATAFAKSAGHEVILIDPDESNLFYGITTTCVECGRMADEEGCEAVGETEDGDSWVCNLCTVTMERSYFLKHYKPVEKAAV